MKNETDTKPDEELQTIPYIEQWRRYRGQQWGRPRGKVTLEELAEQTGLSVGYLSQLQTAKRDGTRSTIRKIARALRCSPEELLEVDPFQNNLSAAMWEYWRSLGTQEEQETALAVLRAVKEKGRRSGP